MPMSVFASQLEEQAKSGNIEAAYQLAERYENNNDMKKALYWYKQAASLSLKNQKQPTEPLIANSKTVTINDTITPDQPQSTTNAAVKAPVKHAVITDRVAIYGDEAMSNDIFTQMNSTFGLRPYHSNYILPITYDEKSHSDGRKHLETTFQISFKKDVFHNVFGYGENIGFAYTQRNWWQITEDSAPFRETNYLPEVYVQVPNQNRDSMLKGAQFGFLHESNGQGDAEGKSRSWNRLYLEGYFNYKDSYIVPRVWYRIPEAKSKDDNRHIENYLGYGDLSIFIPYEKSLVKLLLRNNLKFSGSNHGAFQVDWTYPLGETGLFGYIQYFNGYGESLIDYNKKTNRLGIGVALSR